MRYIVYKTLQKFFHQFGIYTQYYPSDRAIHYHLKSKPIIIQNYELNKVCQTIKASRNHRFYSALLKRFVPLWNIEIKEAWFLLGGGGGQASLNCFRRVIINNTIHFEKVYFREHEGLERIKWFNQHVAQLLNNKVGVPQLHFMYEGKAFVIVYFEYLNLKKIENSELELNFISLAKRLYQASLEFEIPKTGIPAYITNFKTHFEYRNKIEQAELSLSNHGFLIHKIEKEIFSSKLILTHGDIQEKNAFKNHILIDWDTFGLYPIGFEVAFSIFRLLETAKIKTIPSDWLDKNFKKNVEPKHWRDFVRNFNYFLYIFLAIHFKNEQYLDLEKRLIDGLCWAKTTNVEIKINE